MTYKKTIFTLAVLIIPVVTNTAQASLVDRGNGLLYDDVLNVTWLQDANYAKTSGYSTTGQMDWNQASTWATNLSYNGLTGWRLPTTNPGSFSNFISNFSFTGSTDVGYNIISPKSELAYMYYINLGLTAPISTAGTYQSNFGIFGNGTYNGVDQSSFSQNNVGLVINLQSSAYWSGSDLTYPPSIAWYFNAPDGFQDSTSKTRQFYAWAVRPGDVSAVPVPGAIWLFGSGLLGLFGINRRKIV